MTEKNLDQTHNHEEAHTLMKRMAEVYRALGDFNRLHIIGCLSAYRMNNNDTVCVCDLANHLGITQSAVSQHLKVLRNIGLVESIRKGFHKFYSINFEKLNEYMSENQKLFEFAMTRCPEFFEDEKACSTCGKQKTEQKSE
jgi:ArsR family transcriptional regulator, arsenate/arsenite/antimonite-responsive transcriptional repressor